MAVLFEALSPNSGYAFTPVLTREELVGDYSRRVPLEAVQKINQTLLANLPSQEAVDLIKQGLRVCKVSQTKEHYNLFEALLQAGPERAGVVDFGLQTSRCDASDFVMTLLNFSSSERRVLIDYAASIQLEDESYTRFARENFIILAHLLPESQRVAHVELISSFAKKIHMEAHLKLFRFAINALPLEHRIGFFRWASELSDDQLDQESAWLQRLASNPMNNAEDRVLDIRERYTSIYITN